MDVTILQDRIIVNQRGGSTILLGKYAYACRYTTNSAQSPGPQSTYYSVVVYFDEGKGPIAIDTGQRTDEFVFDLRAVNKDSQPFWDNTERGAQNAVEAISPVLRSKKCCGTPGAVIAVNAANCQNLFDPTWGLTEEQLTDCVIPGIDFCDPIYKDALTSEQVECICDIEPCPIEVEVRNTDGDLVDSASIPDPCEQEGPVVLTAPDGSISWDGITFTNVVSGGTIDIDCDTLVDAAYAVDGGSVTGTYKITGTANGRSIYTLDGTHRFEYSGTRWELIKPGGNYQAAVGSETFPWEADWSLTPVTVTQATIGAYCDDCEPANPVEVEVNGTLYASVPAAGSVDIPVINTATTPIGTVTPGVDVEIPDSAISVDSTPELNLPATVALNITLNDGTNPVTPVDVDTSTPGVMAIEIAPCPTPPANVLREYTADDTWSKPSSTFFQGVWVLVAGGAGSGASGSVGATNKTGGTGGSGGALVRRWVPAASLAGTESVTIGAGGATATLSAGNNGADTSFGTHAIAKGGIGGIYNGSATQPGPAGGDVLACTPVASGMADSGAPGGQAGRTTANTLAGGDGMTAFAGAGGGGGGGYTTGGGATGGRGGGTYQGGTLTQGGVGGTAGNNGTDGVSDINLNPFGELVASTIGFGTAGGGGGGSGAAGATGGNGGNGGRAAAGGGGGAGTVTAGTGGSGGNGFCIIYEVYG